MNFLYYIFLFMLPISLTAQVPECPEENRAKQGTYKVTIDKSQYDCLDSIKMRPLMVEELCEIEHKRDQTRTKVILLDGLIVEIYPKSKIKDHENK